MNLTDFLNARLDEAEAAAQAAITAQEEIYPAPGFEVHYEWSRRTRHVSGGGGVEPVPGAPSPSQVLREVAAKRAILLQYTDSVTDWEEDCEAPDAVGALEAVIRLIASAYTDHPDYPEAT